jgi:hypothetical protein
MSSFARKLMMGSILVLLTLVAMPRLVSAAAPGSPNPQSGSIGLQGTISAPPPSKGATISIPTNGQVFTSSPITVSGLCSGDVNVRIFDNNVFVGSVQCINGSFQLQISLFSGRNDLVARVYDNLDQAGPDSNTVTVTFNDGRGPGSSPRVGITTVYAKRGAYPGQTLTWPIEISGGTAPYAISVDWGDGTTTDLKSQDQPGALTLSHVYQNAGIYNIIIRVTDKNGVAAFLQVVGVIYGKTTGVETTKSDQSSIAVRAILPYIIATVALLLPLILLAFWLGRHYELTSIRRRLDRMSRSP